MTDFQLTQNKDDYRCGCCNLRAPESSFIYHRHSKYLVSCKMCGSVGICQGGQLKFIAWKPTWGLVDEILERGMV